MKNITIMEGHIINDSIAYTFAKELSKKYKVNIITGYPSRRVTNEKERQYYKDNPVEKVNDNFTIYRVGPKTGEGNNLFIRTIVYIMLTISMYFKSKKIKTDLFYIFSTPPFLGLISKRIKKIAPVVYNNQDIFPDSYIALKNKKETSFLIRYLRKLEKRIYDNSYKVVTISNQMKKTLEKRIPEKDKIIVIRNWVDVDLFDTVKTSDNILYDKYNLKEENFYITYGGNIGHFQNWQFVLEVVESLKKQENIKFIFFGNGSYVDILKKEIKTRELSNIILLPLQRKEDAHYVYNFGDIVLVPLIENMTNYAFPHKIAMIMATGNPILGLLDIDSEISREINNNRLGFVPGNWNTDEVKKFIVDYKNKKINFNREHVRKYAVENFSLNNQISKYVELTENIFEEKKL